MFGHEHSFFLARANGDEPFIDDCLSPYCRVGLLDGADLECPYNTAERQFAWLAFFESVQLVA